MGKDAKSREKATHSTEVVKGESRGRPRSRTRSFKEHLTPWQLGQPINILDLPLPDSTGTRDSQTFAEHALRNVLITMSILTAVVAIFNRLQLSWGWTVAALALAAFSTRARVEALRDTFHADMERKRGETHEHDAESVEWVNGIVKRIWPLMDPGLFSPLIDLLQTVLDENSPTIVASSRVSDLDVGTNAMRLLSFRLLPHDAQVGDKTGPYGHHADDSLDHVNLEVDFQYSTPPPDAQKLRNIRFMIHLNFGVKKAGVEVPVNVKVTHITGKIRLRLSLTSDPPFVTHTQISFPFMPHLRITARPLQTINVMNVPGISHYILNSLRLTAKIFVAPNSWTLDVSRFLMNSEIQLATIHQGVVVIRIGKLTADRGLSDQEQLYVNIELTTSGKAVYQTRLLRRTDTDIVWAETAFVLVPKDVLLKDESIRLSLFSKVPQQPVDRCLDTVLLSLQKLADAEHSHLEQDSNLSSEFELHWQAAYFGVAAGSWSGPAQAQSRAALYAQRIQEMLDVTVAPPSDLPTGLFSLQIHTVVNVPSETLSCAVFVDGSLRLRTPLSKSGFVDRTAESICLDRSHSVVAVAVLDPEDRLQGALLLRLSIIFAYRSQATRWYHLDGTEAGRIRLSTLFKPISISLPPALISPDLGTVFIHRIVSNNTFQFAGYVRVRVSDSSFVAETREAGSSPAFDNDEYSGEVDRQVTIWAEGMPIAIPILSRQQSTLTFEMVPSDPDDHDGRYYACYHLSSLGETEDRRVLGLAMHHSADKASIRRSMSDFALHNLHPPKVKKRRTMATPPLQSRDPSPVRKQDGLPQIEVELRFEGGSSQHFARLAEVCPSQASSDAALAYRTHLLAREASQAEVSPSRPPDSDQTDRGEVDMDTSMTHDMSTSNSGMSKTSPLKKWAKSSMRSFSGKGKKA